MNILIIGYGAIASYVVRKLSVDTEARIRWVLCRVGRNMNAAEALGPDITPVNTIKEIIETVDLAIECAGHSALAEHGPEILRRGIDIITVSNGALACDELTAQLGNAAQKGRAKLHLVSGAIGAIDAISAAQVGKIDRLIYRGLKPPSGWKGSPAENAFDLDSLDKSVCHFAGTARDAALHYPKNANVAATVAIAGKGLDCTDVELIADPTISENIHEIEAEGAFGRLSFKIEGKPLPGNPKSSVLTAMSIVSAVRRRLVHIKF